MIVADATGEFVLPADRAHARPIQSNRPWRASRVPTLEAIEQRIVPAYRRSAEFLGRRDYLDKTRSTVALSDLPDGKAWYEYLVRTQTTTDLTPEEIFQLGMSEIARIKKKWSGCAGRRTLPAACLISPATSTIMRRAVIKAGAALFKVMRRSDAPWRPGLQKLFGHAPKAPFEIRTIEEFQRDRRPRSIGPLRPMVRVRESFTSTPRVSRPIRAPLPSRSIFTKRFLAITFRSRCNRSAKICRVFSVSPTTTPSSKAGLSTPKALGPELGLYQEPSQYFSRLSSELFRAARLVVDVGLHRKGWSRAQAIKFLMDTALSSESGATLEVDRYIAVARASPRLQDRPAQDRGDSIEGREGARGEIRYSRFSR